MASTWYPKAKEAFMSGLIDLTTANIKAVLLDTDDEVYNAADEFLSDITVAGIEETSANLSSKTVTNGVFDAADVTWPGAAGDPCEAILLYVDTGVAATSRLLLFIDAGTGLPITLNGGDVTSTWSGSGIAAL